MTWNNEKYRHGMAAKGIRTINITNKLKNIEFYPSDIKPNDIIIMIDVDEYSMDLLNWPEDVKEEYINFVKQITTKTKNTIHGITQSDTVLFDWNSNNWKTVEWAENYSEGKISKELINEIKNKYDGKGRIIVFGAMYDDCVRKVSTDLSKQFKKVYRWKNYSIGEDFDTYYTYEY